MELESVDHFQEYVIKAYTSSQPSLVEQIILLSAFVSVLPLCLLTTAEPSIANDYESQLLLCRQSLDSAISRLPFRLPATFDSTLALVMAVRVVPLLSRICSLTRSIEYLPAQSMPTNPRMEPHLCRNTYGAGSGFAQGVPT